MPKNKRINIADIAALALGYIETILAQELPDGKREGREWTALNPTRADGRHGSFKVNTATGVWSDFATGDSGGDLVSLYAYLHDLSQADAAREMAEMYCLDVGGQKAPKKAAEDVRGKWIPIMPVPMDGPEPPKAHYHYGPPSMAWAYRDADNRLLGYVWRISHKDGSKDCLVLTWCKNKETAACEWRFRGFPEPRPLYGLDRLARAPELPVLVVEGEKCADAAKLTLDGSMVVVSWQGGTNAIKNADWSPLKDRIVVVWPDNDLPGFRAARDGWEILKEMASKLTLLDCGEGKPKGWDVADAIEEGLDIAKTIRESHTDPEEFIACYVTPHEGEKIAPEKQATDKKPEKKSAKDKDFLFNDAGFFETSDYGDACRLARLHGDIIRYNHKPFGAWFVWDGRRWVEDRSNRIYALVDDMVRAMYGEAGNITGEGLQESEAVAAKGKRKFIVAHANKLENMHKQRQLVSKAETLQHLAVLDNELDSQNFFFVCENKTLDLSMDHGDVVAREHRQTDYLTRCSPVTYDPEARSPKWDAFCAEIFAEDEAVIQCVRRMVGYTLTGDFSEEKLFFAYGTGANGKSVFFNVMQMLFGEYYTVAPPEMIQQEKFSQHPTDMADLKGKRFAVASELEENKKLMEGKVKLLTGGDTIIKARRMREDSFEFTPTHKLWMFGNHKPKIYGNDHGIWRRIILIPFSVTIAPEKRKPMRVMLDIFRAELSGILNWALTGYVDYCERGIDPPRSMNELVEEYRFDEDAIAQFIAESCDIDPSKHVRALDVYNAYKSWCESTGEYAMTGRRFNGNMRDRGYTVKPGAQNKTHIYGISLKTPSDSQTSMGDEHDDF